MTIKDAIKVGIALMILPVVVEGAIGITQATADLIINAAYNHKIKKGLKKGSIVEINGEYYKVVEDR